MISNVKYLQNIKTSTPKLKFSKIDPKNILKNKTPSLFNKENQNMYNNKNNINNNSLLPPDKNNRRYSVNSAKTRNYENKTIETNLKKINSDKKNINQKKSFVNLSININNILSPRIKRQKKYIRNTSFISDNNNLLPKLTLDKKNINKNRIYYLGGNLSFNNIYYSDLININTNKKEKENEKENNKSNGKEDMISADIKIEQLAKDLNLFQYNKNNKNVYLNNDLSNDNNFSDDEYTNALPNINSDNMSNINSKPQSRISSGTPHSRNYSGKIKNDANNNINKYLNKKINNRLLSPSYFLEKFNIEGTKVMSPLCQKARDIFLYKKIFYYFSGKKTPTIMKKFINNKLNLCYAENEKQFEKKIIQINQNNIKKGKNIIHKVGKEETEKKASDIQKRVEFMKKIFDFAYPDILIWKIKNKCDMEKREIKEKNMQNIIKERELKEKLKIKKYKNSLFRDSIIIKKIK